MATHAADLVALLEEVGPAAAAFGLADSANRAVAVAAERPDLIAGVVCFGPPLPHSAFEGGEGMIGSQAVTDAYREMFQRDYRGALRSALGPANPQLSEEEVQKRVAGLAAFLPRDVAFPRLESWLEDDPTGPARELGDRLAVLISATRQATNWYPEPDELERLTREQLPEARIVRTDDGPATRPEQTAAAIREAAARARI
jgi:pimeloyl-ACP methyl ester carboxylesterase